MIRSQPCQVLELRRARTGCRASCPSSSAVTFPFSTPPARNFSIRPSPSCRNGVLDLAHDRLVARGRAHLRDPRAHQAAAQHADRLDLHDGCQLPATSYQSPVPVTSRQLPAASCQLQDLTGNWKLATGNSLRPSPRSPRSPGRRRCRRSPGRASARGGAAPSVSVSSSRVPVMPSGWPSAIAPPLTLTRSRSRPSSFSTARYCAANASFTSIEIDVLQRQARLLEHRARRRRPAPCPSASARRRRSPSA